MIPLPLQEFHRGLGAHFTGVNEMAFVSHYGDWQAEYAALTTAVGVMDLSHRSRLCLTGADRVRFLHGQVTNDIKRLGNGEGCYAALVTAKGKMQSDLNIYSLPSELLLDFEPGLASRVSQRLERFIVADDVEVVDVGTAYGLWTVQGPRAQSALRQLNWFSDLPGAAYQIVQASEPGLGELYLANHPRLGSVGFDLFAPAGALHAVAEALTESARSAGGCLCGWQAFEATRIEARIPRFGVDMDETHIPIECGIESRAISYRKGCYIGQEVLNRIHSIGHVNRMLRALRMDAPPDELPMPGDKLVKDGKDVGYVTSATRIPASNSVRALGYVGTQFCQAGMQLQLRSGGHELSITVE